MLGLQFNGADAFFEEIIKDAGARFERIITGDIPSVTLGDSQRPNGCGLSSRVIDDVEICVKIEELPRNILGVGGVRYARTNVAGQLLPVTGEISIDRSAHENDESRLYETAVCITSQAFWLLDMLWNMTSLGFSHNRVLPFLLPRYYSTFQYHELLHAVSYYIGLTRYSKLPCLLTFRVSSLCSSAARSGNPF
jgi:hypothetical protein